MPSASANISAKFIAQIEMSITWAPRKSEPAEATSPRMVSMSGSPAATSEPNARSRMPSVTGQEISSDLSIADLLASLKSDHMPEAPVSDTWMPSPASSASGALRSSAARTISLESAAAPACTMAVRPSREIDRPGRGGTTAVTRSSAARIAWARSSADLNSGSSAVASSECTTTMSAEDDSPPNSRSTISRTRTDSEPVASQPAPDRACSTLGANAPRAMAMAAHARATVLRWVAVQRPSRPIVP